MEPSIWRYREAANSGLDSILVPKHQRRIARLDERVLVLSTSDKRYYWNFMMPIKRAMIKGSKIESETTIISLLTLKVLRSILVTQ